MSVLTRKRYAVAIITVVLVASSVSPASARSAEPEVPTQREVLVSTQRVDVVRDGDWILWDFRQDLPDAVMIERQGSPTWDGLSDYRVASTSDGSTIEGYFRIYREIASNSKTCAIRFAVANLPIERLGEFDGSNSEGGESVSAGLDPSSNAGGTSAGNGPSLSSSGTVQLAASTTSTAWYKTVWEDPVNLDVNSVKVNLTWVRNGSCVTSSSNHTAVWYYFTGTGWYLQSSSGSGARNCTYAATQATGLFYNYAWNNDSLLTWTKHTNTTIYGYANGSIGRANTMTKGGENNSLLHTDFLCSWTSC